MLTVPEAVAEITRDIKPRDIERVSLLDVLGRVLASDAVARYTLPQWDNSAMDGYAVRAADIEGASAEKPVVLPVLETVAAGSFASRAIKAGETEESRHLRWSARLGNSLVNNFRGEWPLNWNGRPFDNTFWLRNPTVIDERLMDYDGGREVGALLARLADEALDARLGQHHADA